MGLISSLLRSKTYLFVNSSNYMALCLFCIPVLFTDNAKCQFVIAQYGFLLASLPHFLKRPGIEEKFLTLFVMLCNEYNIHLTL